MHLFPFHTNLFCFQSFKGWIWEATPAAGTFHVSEQGDEEKQEMKLIFLQSSAPDRKDDVLQLKIRRNFSIQSSSPCWMGTSIHHFLISTTAMLQACCPEQVWKLHPEGLKSLDFSLQRSSANSCLWSGSINWDVTMAASLAMLFAGYLPLRWPQHYPFTFATRAENHLPVLRRAPQHSWPWKTARARVKQDLFRKRLWIQLEQNKQSIWHISFSPLQKLI